MNASLAHLASTVASTECVERIADLVDDLQRLGPVLCLYPSGRLIADRVPLPVHAPWPMQRELTALLVAAGLRVERDISSDGPNERIWFLDPAGRPSFGLWLLPDTDYLAWDALLAEHSTEQRTFDNTTGWCERMRQRWHGWLAGGSRWCGGVRRFRISRHDGRLMLGLLPVPNLSPLGCACATRIASAHALHIDPPEFATGHPVIPPGTSWA
ncbi:MAG TPA: hypothetical protein DDZ76_00715 [Xanthomonadales bacterium]|nr:hypothetical protein [Xanthomonadales bacterium]